MSDKLNPNEKPYVFDRNNELRVYTCTSISYMIWPYGLGHYYWYYAISTILIWLKNRRRLPGTNTFLNECLRVQCLMRNFYRYFIFFLVVVVVVVVFAILIIFIHSDKCLLVLAVVKTIHIWRINDLK